MPNNNKKYYNVGSGFRGEVGQAWTLGTGILTPKFYNELFYCFQVLYRLKHTAQHLAARIAQVYGLMYDLIIYIRFDYDVYTRTRSLSLSLPALSLSLSLSLFLFLFLSWLRFGTPFLL